MSDSIKPWIIQGLKQYAITNGGKLHLSFFDREKSKRCQLIDFLTDRTKEKHAVIWGHISDKEAQIVVKFTAAAVDQFEELNKDPLTSFSGAIVGIRNLKLMRVKIPLKGRVGLGDRECLALEAGSIQYIGSKGEPTFLPEIEDRGVTRQGQLLLAEKDPAIERWLAGIDMNNGDILRKEHEQQTAEPADPAKPAVATAATSKGKTLPRAASMPKPEVYSKHRDIPTFIGNHRLRPDFTQSWEIPPRARQMLDAQDLPIAQPDSDSFSDEDEELSEENDGDFYNSPPPAAASPAPTEYFEWGSSPVRPPAESRIKPTTNPPVNPLAKDDDEDFLLDWEEEIVNENEQATNAVPLAQPFVPPVSTPFTFGFTVTTTGSGEQIPPTDTSNDSRMDMSAALRNATENLPSFLDTSISVDQPSTAPTKTSETKQQSQDSNETVTTIEITPSNQVSLSAEIPAAQRSSKLLNEDGEEESSSESKPESEQEVRYLTDVSSQLSELGESSEESETGDDEQEPPARQVKKEPSPQKTRISAPSKVVSKHTDIPVSEAPQSLSGLASGEPSSGPAKEPKTVHQTEDITGSRNVNNDASTRPIDLPPTDSTIPLPPDETRSISRQPTAAKVKHLTSIKHDDSSTKASFLGKRRASEDADDQGPMPASKRVKPSFNDDPNTKKGLTGAEQGGVVNPTTRPTTVKRMVAEAAMRTHSRAGASIAGPAAPKPDSVAVPRYRAIGHSNGSRPQWGVEVRDGSSMRKLFDLFMEKEVRPKTNGPRRPASEKSS